ncbi:hypothetical protein B0O99DRAFT_631864 [Bisporella sp. PMI_857]|nr:hypothetical protein B0O99DRAFT_631864 [Bisporella sp. PMI_857]
MWPDHAPRRFVLLGIFLTFFTAILIITRFTVSGNAHIRPILDKIQHPSLPTAPKPPSAPKPPEEPEPGECTEHLGWLEHYQFTYPIKYVSRDIIARARADKERPSLTILEKPLFAGFTTLDTADSHTVKFEKCYPPLELDVPHGVLMPSDASNMIFGLQTTMGRLRATVKHLARWLPNTGARLFAIVIEAEGVPAADDAMTALEKEFRDKGMLVSIVHPVQPEDSFAQRYFSLSNVMYGARDEKTQWVVHIDDDTFFPSMWDLQEELKKHDSKKPLYLGSLSEDWWAVNHYGLMGFGGAGIILSLPMAEIIDNHTQECKEHLRTTAGDISVMDCIYQFSTTKLTHIPSLHQVDMHGDLSGFYESGREMLSLHHWKEGSTTGYKLEMEKMHLVADVCDSCFLQRWQFPNELLLSNGFSITSYPEGSLSGNKPGVVGAVTGMKVDKIDLMQMEKTWGDEINVLHSLAPVRDKLPDGKKISYKLLDSVLVKGEEVGAPGQKVVRQVYFKEGADKGGIDTVLVLNWRSAGPDPKPPVEPEPANSDAPAPVNRDTHLRIRGRTMT